MESILIYVKIKSYRESKYILWYFNMILLYFYTFASPEVTIYNYNLGCQYMYASLLTANIQKTYILEDEI